jgi:aryl-alcohol dehydrogenase-like predicted oxidoreductase
MKYRSLGSTGLTVSEIGFGAWGIGGTAGGSVAYGPTDDNESTEALRLAFDRGITFYDTADFYGFGHSEEVIGQALVDARDRIVIASKVGMIDKDGNQDFSIRHIRKSLDASLKRLQTDYIDLYQLHSPRTDLANWDEILSELTALRATGKIRAFGVSLRSVDDGISLITEHGFQCIQVNLNLVDQRAAGSGLLEFCEKKQVGVIIRTPLSFGFLTGEYSAESGFDQFDHRRKWSSEQMKRWTGAGGHFSHLFSKNEKQTPAQFALRFCLSHRSVSTVIPGMLNRAHVEENAAASDMGVLSQDQMNGIADVYKKNEFFVGR